MNFRRLLILLPLAALWSTAEPDLHIADGNNNGYHLRGEELVYDPVKMEESSSGLYFGGKPARAKLKKSEAQLLRVLARQLLSHPENLAKSRNKGTIMISFGEASGKIALGTCQDWKNLEKVLKKLLKI